MVTKEVWLPINGYEDRCLISNLGRVKNKATLKILRVRFSRTGYARVNLSKGGSLHTERIHRLVGTHFIPNPDNLPELNHINEDKSDNRAENLEWCDKIYNVNFGSRTDRQKEKVSKAVIQLSADDREIAHFCSTVQAGKQTGVNSHRIADCCRGTRKTAGGFKWKYEGGANYDQQKAR